MPSSASDPIYDAIRAQILSGSIKAGSPLRQDEIAKQFGVSKIPVREALRQLEIDDLVTFERNKGATVRHVSEVEILQLLDIRIALECRALELAVPRMIEADFRDMRKLLSDYEKRTKIEDWSELNIRFHHMLYEPSGNGQLLRMINDLQERLGKYLRLLVTEVTGLERPMREHEEILNACEQSNVETAVQILRQHIQATQKEVASFLRRGA